MSAKNWVNEHIYFDIHEVFFSELPHLLHEWFLRLVTKKKKFQIREAIKWSGELVYEVSSVSNPISRAFDFWVDSILQGYITEFAIDTITSYSEAKRNFFQGP